jgi:hypothetical protein
MNQHNYEAHRYLRLIEERDPQCARLLVKAIEEFNLAGGDMPIRYILLQIYTAIPEAALSEKEKEFLCQKSSECLTSELKPSKHRTGRALSA